MLGLTVSAFVVTARADHHLDAMLHYPTEALAQEERQDLWQWLAVFMAGNLVSGVVGFITLHRRIVTVAEVRAMIQEGPWSQERAGVLQRLEDQSERIERQEKRTADLERFLFEARNEMMKRFDAVGERLAGLHTETLNALLKIQKQIGGSNRPDDD